LPRSEIDFSSKSISKILSQNNCSHEEIMYHTCSYRSCSLFTFIGTVNAQVPVYEETFETGPNGWTSESETPNDTSLWVWDMDGFVGDGALANAIWELGSESMVFNADFYTTQGDPANIPSGPASTYPKYISHLISPTLDLSGVTTALAVSWTQIVRFLNVSPGAPGNFRASISVSTDDGATWSEPIDALPGKAVNTFYDVETVSTVPIPAIQGSSTAKIRFTFSSDFYFWVVDDIQLTETGSPRYAGKRQFLCDCS
jgi:hypothetical protein